MKLGKYRFVKLERNETYCMIFGFVVGVITTVIVWSVA